VIRLIRSTAVALLGAVLVAACGDDSSPAAPVTIQVIEETTFAASLGIDLSQMTKTASGLYIQIKVPGEGDPAVAGNNVDVAYTGRLSNAAIFDAGVFPFTLGTGSAIPGFDEGATGMKLNEERVVIIPPAQAYGSQAVGSIPAGSILIFEMRLAAIN